MLVVVILFDLIFYSGFFASRSTPQSAQVTLTYSAFVTQVDANNVKTAKLSSTTASGDFRKPYTQNGKSYPSYTTTLVPVPDNNLVPLLEKHRVQITGQSSAPATWQVWLGFLIELLPFIFLIALFYFVGRRMRGQQQ